MNVYRKHGTKCDCEPCKLIAAHQRLVELDQQLNKQATELERLNQQLELGFHQLFGRSAIDSYTGERVSMRITPEPEHDCKPGECEACDYDRATGEHGQRRGRVGRQNLPLAIVVRSSRLVTAWRFMVRSLLTAARWVRRTTSSTRRSGGESL